MGRKFFQRADIKMKRKILTGLLLLVTAAAVWYLLKQSQAGKGISIFLPDEAGNWRAVPTDISDETTPENLERAMRLLLAGFPERGLPTVFSPEIEYYSILRQNETAVEINFKQGYVKMPDLQKGLCEAALVHTFSGFSGLDRIYLYEEGVPLSSLDRHLAFERKVGDAYLSFADSTERIITETETLYFFDEQRGKLTAVRQNVSRPVYESRGQALLTALQKNPAESELESLLDGNITVNDVRIRSGVCYVDFDQDFVKAYAEMGANKFFLIYSIVNSLASLEKVEYVQFLINGENPEKYNETLALKMLFRKNLVYTESL